MFILSSVSRGLEFLSVSDTSIYKNSELNALSALNALSELSSN